MKSLKRFLVFLLVLIALVLIVAIFLPSKLRIEDSTAINASPELIFKHVNSLKNWAAWSPFQKEDTAMTSVYEGPEEGVGAKQTWKSKVNGDGSMTISESTPYTLIKMNLEFSKQNPATCDWKLVPKEKSTEVTWGVDLNLSYPMGRLFGLFMPKMMHKAFQGGLEDLKKLCEAEFMKNMVFKTGEITIKESAAWKAIAVKDSSTCDKVGEVMTNSMTELMKYCEDNKIECAGPPYAIYYKWDQAANKFVMETGFPVKVKCPVKGRVYFVEYPKRKVVTALHTGSYEMLMMSYQAVEKYIKDQKLKQKGYPWEVYLTDPSKEKDVTKLQTQLYYPIE